MTLVPIPWQPWYLLTPDTLTMLQLASAHAGHNIPVSDAWRSYAEQKGYWDAYQRYLRGGPYAAIASNPDTGQRNHMRAAAVDIQNRADRAAMLAVGFTPDPDEWWHFNNPRWASMPIITANTTAAGGAATPIITPDIPQEEDMRVIRAENGSIALVGERYFGEYGGQDKDGVDAAVAAFGPVRAVTNAQYNTIKARALGRRDELVNAIAAAVKR